MNSVWEKTSTGKIVKSIFDSSENDNIYVLYGRGQKVKTPKVFKFAFEIESKFCHFLSLFTGNLYGGMFFSTNRAIKLIKKIHPDLINIHCLNGYCINIYRLLNFLKKTNIKIVLTNHADFYFTANCGVAYNCMQWAENECAHCEKVEKFNSKLSLNLTHKYFKKMESAFCGFQNLISTSVSPWLMKRSQSSPILKNYQHFCILNPVNTNLDIQPQSPYKTQNNVLFVTRDYNDYIKGFDRLVQIGYLSQHDNINFYVISQNKRNIKSIANKYKNLKIFFIEDIVSQSELFSYYYYADLSVILSRFETFSMVVAESLVAGTPVLGFKCGGPEEIAIPAYSKFVKTEKEFYFAMKNMIETKWDKSAIAKEAKNKYSENNIVKEYFKLFHLPFNQQD